MAYKGQNSFGITAILYTYWACKTLLRLIKPTNSSVQMTYKDQSSFGKADQPLLKNDTTTANMWYCEIP